MQWKVNQVLVEESLNEKGGSYVDASSDYPSRSNGKLKQKNGGKGGNQSGKKKGGIKSGGGIIMPVSHL